MKKIKLKRISLEEAGISQSDIVSKKDQKYIMGGYDGYEEYVAQFNASNCKDFSTFTLCVIGCAATGPAFYWLCAYLCAETLC